MMKFFRKYNKQLLSVFMALLMIVFIGGSAFESLMAPSFNPVAGDSKYGDITRQDQAAAENTTSVLEALGFNWRRQVGEVEPLTITDWILLSREAESMGIRMDITATRAQLADFLTPDMLEESALRLRRRPDDILAAVGQMRAIQQAGLAMAAASHPSVAEIRTAAKRALDKARIRAVKLPARAFVNEDAQIPESELEALLEKYRDTEPGRGMNFGYYVPTAIKVQYIKIDRDKLAQQIGIPNLEREAQQYYEAHREDAEFERPQENKSDAPTDADAAGEDGATDESPYLSWEEAKDKAITTVRKQHADDVANRIAEWIISYTTDSTIDVPRGDNGYKQLPDQFKDLDLFAEILGRLPRKLQHLDAVTVEVTDFFTENKLDEVAGIGLSWARDGQGSWLGAFRNFAFQTKAIVPDVSSLDNSRSLEYLAPFQTCPVQLTDNDGNKYVFRVIDHVDGHPAKDVDEVREELVEDARLLRAWNRAKSVGESLMFATETLDLADAFAADIEIQQLISTERGAGIEFVEPEPFPRVEQGRAVLEHGAASTNVPELGRLDTATIDEIFALAEAGFQTGIVELDEQAVVLVVEGLDIQPGRIDEYESLKQSLAGQISSIRRQRVMQKWFDPEQIRARTGFEPATN